MHKQGQVSKSDTERRITLSTTVPEWLDRVIEEMAKEQLVSKSVFLRQMLLRHVRGIQAADDSAA